MSPDTKVVGSQDSGQAADAVFADIAEKIIEQQEAIIGPIAISQANIIAELSIDWPQHVVTITGDPKAAIDNLVEQYKQLFGQIAVQTCKEAASRFLAELPAEQWPSSLK